MLLPPVVSMLASCRILLIALVAAGPLLSGLQEAVAERVAAPVIGPCDPSPADGSREDSAGTLFEESSEHDSEQDEVRVDHGSVTPAWAVAADSPRRFSPSGDRPRRPCRGAMAALSRGPPAHG
ncbi:MAG: hypothetical protein FJ286_17385 [Planctomycetes bacterium]|nr:hypothetical protein [Planctomycetota bacterium]